MGHVSSLRPARRLAWASTTALVLVIIMQVAACNCQGVKRAIPSKLQGAEFAVSAAPSTVLGDLYRPPLINFNYQGGPVLWKPIHIYIVWYGSWSASEKDVIRTSLSSLTPKHPIQKFPNLANLWKVVTSYYQELPGEPRKYASNKVTIAQEVDDRFSNKSIDPDNDPFNIIQRHVQAGNLAFDPEQGVYFILTAADVAFTTSQYCGYHFYNCYDTAQNCTDQLDTRNNLIFSFVPLPSEANGLLSNCNDFASGSSGGIPGPPPNHKVSPSGALDSLIDTFMHELMELTVDPYLTAWLNNVTENSETADLCNFSYAAGDYYYCDLSTYDDFPGVHNNSCYSFPNDHYLTDPESKVHFNQHGLGESQFLVQKIWSLANKGCVSQPEGRCPSTQVQLLNKRAGKIQRGLFSNGVGLQTYAPGQNCRWEIKFTGPAMEVTFTFEILALGYDDLDYIKISQKEKVVKKLTGFGKSIVFKATGKEFEVQFVSFGGRSPYPASAGFILHYTAKRHY